MIKMIISINKDKLFKVIIGAVFGLLLIVGLAGEIGILSGEFEPTYYTGTLSDIEIENAGISTYSKTN